MVRTYAQTIKVKRSMANAYDDLHVAVWREVLDSLRAIGVIDMKIYRSGERLFMHLTCEDGFDPRVDFERHASMNARCEEWSALTRMFQEPSEDAREGEWWTPMDEVFDLREQLERAVGTGA